MGMRLEKNVGGWERYLVFAFRLAKIKKNTSCKVKFVPVYGQIEPWGSRLDIDRLFPFEELMTLYSLKVGFQCRSSSTF